jgi:nitroimidazol reductase NimA-like FMN-containing flavoprotein (pyridoxamine 5'-phosphate oxidase superfamily)
VVDVRAQLTGPAGADTDRDERASVPMRRATVKHEDGFGELGRDACLALLARAAIGRIVYTRGALPDVLPVRFSLDDDFSVVVRTSAASRLAGSVEGSVVAFEADQFDESAGSGWSVTVTGRATLVTESGARNRAREADPRSSAPTRDEIFIRIAPELVTGRIAIPRDTAGAAAGS